MKGTLGDALDTQGVALGFVVVPFQGKNQNSQHRNSRWRLAIETQATGLRGWFHHFLEDRLEHVRIHAEFAAERVVHRSGEEYQERDEAGQEHDGQRSAA